MKVVRALGLAASLGISSAVYAAAPAEIVLPGQGLFTESLTSTTDGSVIVGSVGGRTIFRSKPGAGTAEAWIKPGTNGLTGIFGVFADDQANTLWACSGLIGAPGTTPATFSLHAFDLKSGAPKGKWVMPTAGGSCNDIAVGADGSAYATDTTNMEIVKLKPGAQALEVWAGNGAFGPKGGVLDGIAVLQDKVVVNTLATGKLFSVPIGADGKAGAVAEVRLDRALERPDGQRAFGKSSILVVEGGGSGRLSRVTLSGANLDSGKITVIKEGFPDGPVAVTLIGDTAYVLEGQIAAMRAPPGANVAPKPFKATAVQVGKP
jgi:sugar lactone lactonase YvrE